MDDLDKGVQDAAMGAPSPEDEAGATPQPPEEEKDLTDEELKEQIEKLREDAKKEEDPTTKRHLEQQAGWSQKIMKEREKAKALEEGNRKAEEAKKALENALVEEAYSKAVDDAFGLPYFENLAKTNPELADRVAKEKWGKKSAKEVVMAEKRKRAEAGDEDSKRTVTEEEIRASEREKILHELAVEQVDAQFD